jgi:hypothetical protein
VANGGAGPTFGGVEAAATCDLHVPPAARAALIRFAWQPGTAPGLYVRVVVERAGSDAPRQHVAPVSILGPRSAGQPVATLVPLDGRTGQLTVRLSNAYDDARMSVGEVDVRMLGAPADGAESYPAGRVGLVFADADQLPALVRDMRAHYGHYRDSARQFAAKWRAEHDAGRVVQRLLSGTRAGRRSVA